jgi:hypothetical protein
VFARLDAASRVAARPTPRIALVSPNVNLPSCVNSLVDVTNSPRGRARARGEDHARSDVRSRPRPRSRSSDPRLTFAPSFPARDSRVRPFVSTVSSRSIARFSTSRVKNLNPRNFLFHF